MVERKSRFVMLWRNPSRTSAGVMAGIEAKLAPLPSSLRQSITFDRGTEFAAYGTLRSRMGMDSYFCEPRSPWQKGGVENLNGRLRRFLPLDVDIAALPVDAIEAVSARLNDTPRKCLEYRTPREVLAETMAVHGAKDDGSSGVGLAPPRMKW
jgi:IS30 family transposase